ncbi:hypothetical protein [Streptomyces sp. NPDC057545]|uniref:hypothetical protein n=1 Tax=Streptomyces sp. NPDC057545 TaxID=3346164 RepID=UPI0036CF25AE
MTHFPGHRPIPGDAVSIWIDDATITATGAITCRGVVEDGQGYAELCLPDADPEQRRALERCSRYGFDLYLDGGLLYSSPKLVLHSASRTKDGSLVVRGVPGGVPERMDVTP